MQIEPTLNALPPLHASGIVDFDATVFVSAAFFLGFYFVMKTMLFDPYLRIVRERQQLTGGAQDEAKEFRDRADAVMTEYEEKLGAARDEAADIRAELRDSGRADEQRIVSAAREQASNQLAARRERLATEVADAEQQIDTRARTLSSAIVERVVA